MKVLLKSLKELKYEYGIEEKDIANDMIKVFGKVVEAKYDEESDSYVINYYWLHPNLIKGEVIKEETKYTIKRLSDGIEYDFIERRN